MYDYGIESRTLEQITDSIQQLALTLNTPEKVDYALYHLSINDFPVKFETYSKEVVGKAIRQFYYAVPNLFCYTATYKTKSEDIQLYVNWINGALGKLIRPLGDCQSSKLLYTAIKFCIRDYDDYDGFSAFECETINLFYRCFDELMEFIGDFIKEYDQEEKETK